MSWAKRVFFHRAGQSGHGSHSPVTTKRVIAVIGSDQLHSQGWNYLFVVMVGAFCMLMVALLINNLFAPGIYPERWD